MTTPSRSATTDALFRVGAVIVAPALALFGHAYHPWIGSPGDEGFAGRLAAAIAADPTRWAVSHLFIALGSAAVALAFLAVRRHLHEEGEERYSPVAFPFILVGSVLYAMLPAMEFAPLAAFEAGADVAAVQIALTSWFGPLLLTAAAVFAVGALGFAIGIVRSGVLTPWLGWLVAFALVVMAGSRFLPVGAAQLYVGPVAGAVALWALAPALWTRTEPRSVRRPEPRPGAEHPATVGA